MEPIADENYNNKVINFDNESFQIKEETETTLNNIRYGDFCVLGKIWIHALKTVLVGANFGLMPVVHAAKPPQPEHPQKPPKMKYKDLPVYSSPHMDYKEYEGNKYKCPNVNVKVIHSILLPYVKSLREKSADAFSSACCTAKCTILGVCDSVSDSNKQFKRYMRDPNNLRMRQGVVASGTLVGYLLGRGGGIPKRVIYTGLGALAAGSLCFPKETDEIFRDVAHETAKIALAFYNIACRKQASLGEKMACYDELPPPKICPKKIPPEKKPPAKKPDKK